jgi:sugar/nucleoside kinase (ribokinase family)
LWQDGAGQVIPSIPEYVHRDSTGAGDAFLAGFLYGLYHDCSAQECVLFGNITGGKCVTAVGCLTAWCTEQELLETAEAHRRLLS